MYLSMYVYASLREIYDDGSEMAYIYLIRNYEGKIYKNGFRSYEKCTSCELDLNGDKTHSHKHTQIVLLK